MTIDSLQTLRTWLDTTRGVSIPLGPSNASSIVRAREVLTKLKVGVDRALVDALQADSNGPEILHALCNLLVGEGATVSSATIESVYFLTSSVRWTDDFFEGEDLLARLAFLRWDECRRSGWYSEARKWRSRCATHALAQDHIRAFLTSSFDERSAELNSRFLSDQATVLTCWWSLDSRRNHKPKEVVREARGLAEWLESCGVQAGLPTELVHFLAAGAWCTVMIAQNHLGSWDEWKEWEVRARQHASLSESTAELVALMDQAEGTRLCQQYEYRRAEAIAKSLIPRLEALGLSDQVARSKFLLARTVKDQCRFDEAQNLFAEVNAAAIQSGDLILQCLALSERAQVLGREGRFEEAMLLVDEARSITRRSDCPWIEGDLQGTVGELLRDNGDFVGSIGAYSEALSCYENLGMVGMAAYLRIVLAETLLLAGRPAEAVSHVILALPEIEKKHLSREAIPALGLLREALRRSQADPVGLCQLREEFRRMKDHGRL